MIKYTKHVITINIPLSAEKIMDSSLGDEMADVLFPETDNIITRSDLFRRVSLKTCEKLEKLEKYGVPKDTAAGKVITINEEREIIEKVQHLLDMGFFVSRSEFYRFAFFTKLLDSMDEIERRREAARTKTTVSTEVISAQPESEPYVDWVKIVEPKTQQENKTGKVEIVKISGPTGVKVYKIVK